MNEAGIEIGETLRAARKRAGLDLAALEQRTHIRRRYLQALEDEHWEELPGTAYAQAFLRTYAEELGLDADALADELRLRQGGRVGGAEALITPPTGPEPRPSRWLVAAIAGGIVLLLLVFAFTGQDDEPADDGDRSAAGPRGNGQPRKERPDVRPAKLALVPLTASRVCVASGGKALVSRQILSPTNREEFEPARRFVVDLEFGEVRLRTRGEQTRLRADSASDPLTVVVRPGKIRRVAYSGDSCP